MNKGSINKVILCGRLGKDPEQNQTPGGLAISKFSLATTDSRKDKNGQWEDTTEWHNCVAFGKTADYINNYVGKGRLVALEGKLKTSTWEKDGIKHYKTDIIIDQLVSLDKAPVSNDNEMGVSAQPKQEKTQSATIPNSSEVDTGDDLPF